MLVQFSGVTKNYGASSIFRDISFQIYPGDKIGLIGANGAGKTTILKVLSRFVDSDGGTVTHQAGLRLGSLDQIPDFDIDATVLDEVLTTFADLQGMEAEMRHLEAEISGTPIPADLDRYSAVQHAFELRGGYGYRARAEAALQGVGFSRAALAQPCRTLSGGEKNRLALARLLVSDADLLLLDEPTNHLDIRSIEWLEGFLRDTAKAVLLISHDRFFLDKVAGRIFDLQSGRLDEYRGNYTHYLGEREERRARQQKEFDQQQAWIERTEEFIRRNIAGQKTKQAQSRRKLLQKTQVLDRPLDVSARVRFRFVPKERSARHVFGFRKLSIGYGSTVLARDIDLDVERGERWAILGPNGAGKTTLLRTLVGRIPAVEGSIEWPEGLDVGYYDQQLADLSGSDTVLDELRSIDLTATDGELRSFLAQFHFSGDDVFKRVSSLSGGEKSRLALARIIYECPSVLALDEPTNHLDIAAREALEDALAEYPGTLLFVTHDRYLARKLATRVIYLEGGCAREFDGFDAFESWLATPADSVRPEVDESVETRKNSTGLSKNRREQLAREAAAIEASIASLEIELASIEADFEKPATGVNWEETHRRYDTLKASREEMYEALAGKLGLLQD